MNPPLIGITTYGRNDQQRYTLPTAYVDAVRTAGGIPVMLPPGEPHLAALLPRLDGLILSGGGDIDPAHYGGSLHPTMYNISAARDTDEIEIARTLIARDIPLLAICRGSQVVNVALGGTLIAHLPDVVGEDTLHRAPPRRQVFHPVAIEPDSRLAAIVGQTEITPVSWHHQAIDQLAPGLEVVATAPDGTIEAVEMPTHPWLVAVQWHPELSAADDLTQQRLFDELVSMASEKIAARV